MSCPHGSGPPKMCSQCRGAKVDVVTRVEDGVWSVGGRIINRTGALQKQANYGTVMTANGAKMRCGYCRKVGHKAEDCREKRNNEAMAAAKLGVVDVLVQGEGRASTKKAS